jgi:urea transport system ATP-binding protein
MLKLVNVTSYYGKTPIIRDVSLEVPAGECLCVLGRNGVGKTTLLQSIMGLTTRMTGKLIIDGEDLSEAPSHKRATAGLGYVPQGRRIFEKFTVRENIQLGTFARADDSRSIPDHCLDLFPYLADNMNKRAGLLSGGQQQQLAISRALATDPKILLLDEPTEGIQPNIVAEIERLLTHLVKEAGITLVLTEQHIKIARKMSDRFVLMESGKVTNSGEIGDLTDELVNAHLTI